mgnify:CR=1 FL=1
MSTPIPTQAISVDSTLIAAAVSAIISVAILFVSNYFIQPHRFRLSLKVEYLEKSLHAYGTLITILESMTAKRQRVSSKLNPQKSEEYSHQMENPFDYQRLVDIIEKNKYLFSTAILEKWYKVLEQDKYFHIHTSMKKGSGLLLVDFRELQNCATREYSDLKIQYQNITGISIPN